MEQCADQSPLTRILQLLRCPRCCELPSAGPIYACERGHTLCGRCYKHLEKGAEPDELFRCVVCHSRLRADRNMVAEQMVRSLGKRALARSRQRIMVLDDGNVRVVSDQRPRLIVVHTSNDSGPVALPPPPPPAPLPAAPPSHYSRALSKPQSGLSSHEMPCHPGCTCPRCSALLAFYAAWLPADAQTAGRSQPLPLASAASHGPPPPPSSPPSPPPMAPETSSREVSPTGSDACPAYKGPRHPPPRPTAQRNRAKTADEDISPILTRRPPSSQSSAHHGYSGTGGTHHGTSSATSSVEPVTTIVAAPSPVQAERHVRCAYHPLCGGDATSFASACRCYCNCPCTAVKSQVGTRASNIGASGYADPPKESVERRVPTMRPVRCPKPSCGSLLAASALVAHFAFDHSDVPLLPVDPGDETQLWLSAEDIPLEMVKVQALLLLPLHSEDRCPLRPTGEPLVTRYGLRRPLPLLTGRCRLAAETESTTDTGEEAGRCTPASARGSSAPFTAVVLSSARKAGGAADEVTAIHKDDTLVMWLADVDGSAKYTMEVTDGVRKYAYTAPAVGLRTPQNPRSVYRSGEAATLTGSFVKRVARAGGFTLTVTVH